MIRRPPRSTLFPYTTLLPILGRIKQHTDFRSDVESGLMKMSAIGLGKHAQALALHAHGVKGIRDYMVEAGEKVFAPGKVLFGVGIVENAYQETAIIEAIPPERDRKSTRLNSSHANISYAVFCLK